MSESSLANLDNHIGRVTAKWKEQGVYIAVTDIAAWFDYGVDENALRQVFLTRLYERAKNSTSQQPRRHTYRLPSRFNRTPSHRSISRSQRSLLQSHRSFCTTHSSLRPSLITNDTFALVLRRIGDKNVLPHVHIMLSFLTTFAPNKYVSHLLADSPWAELVAFLNTLVKTEHQIQAQAPGQMQAVNINEVLTADVFPGDGERGDELPLPEDYLVRGLIWAQEYFPQKWFEREHDEEERYLELASTVKSRMERVLRLGYQLTKVRHCLSFSFIFHTDLTIVQSLDIIRHEPAYVFYYWRLSQFLVGVVYNAAVLFSFFFFFFSLVSLSILPLYSAPAAVPFVIQLLSILLILASTRYFGYNTWRRKQVFQIVRMTEGDREWVGTRRCKNQAREVIGNGWRYNRCKTQARQEDARLKHNR